MNSRRKFSDVFRCQVVKEYQSGSSYYSLLKKYGLSYSSIQKWMTTFGVIQDNNTMKKEPEFSSAEEEIAYLREELKMRERSYQAALLKSESLDQMIQIAEAKYKLPIRKKSGTKQS